MKILKKYIVNKIFLLGILTFFNLSLEAQDSGREFGFYNNILMQNDMIGMPVTMDWGFYFVPAIDMSVSTTSPLVGIYDTKLKERDLLIKLYNNTSDTERFLSDININLIGFGFMPNDRLYLGFGVDFQHLLQFSVSRDFIGALFKGNYDGENLNSLQFGNTQASTEVYLSTFAAASYKWEDHWTFGAKFKIFKSLANVRTGLKSAKLTPTQKDGSYHYNFQYDGQFVNSLHKKGGLLNSVEDVLNSVEDVLDYQNNISKFLSDILSPSNVGLGFGLDLGATFSWQNIDGYVGIENVPLVSFLNSPSQTKTVSYKGQVNLEPISVNGLDLDTLSNSDNILDRIEDEVKNQKTKIKENAGIYLPTHINLAGKYQLAEINNFGFQSRFSFYEYQNFVNFTPFYMLNLWDYFQTKVGWTFSNRYNTNLNLDFSINFGIQLFVGAENLLSYLNHKTSLNNASVRFGIAFGDFFGGSNDLDVRKEREINAAVSPLGMPIPTSDEIPTEEPKTENNNSTDSQNTSNITELVDEKIGTPIQETEEAKKDLEETKTE